MGIIVRVRRTRSGEDRQRKEKARSMRGRKLNGNGSLIVGASDHRRTVNTIKLMREVHATEELGGKQQDVRKRMRDLATIRPRGGNTLLYVDQERIHVRRESSVGVAM